VPYDERLAGRVRTELAGTPGLSEKRMFGGLCFLLRGNMACGIVRDSLMVRVGAAAYDAALRQPHARVMDFTGKPMKGMVYVAPEGVAAPADLAAWLRRAVDFAGRLPSRR